MSVDRPIDAKAAAIVQPMLDAGETLIWAEQPDFRLMLRTSIRAFILSPWHWGAVLGLAAFGIWRFWLSESMPMPPELSWFVFALLAFPLVVDLAGSLFVVTPFFAPVAYGATQAYIVTVRGLLARRLLRVPVSVVADISLGQYAGAAAIQFRMNRGKTSDFAFFHSPDPNAALSVLRGLIPASESAP
jgi:hypothetical protein